MPKLSKFDTKETTKKGSKKVENFMAGTSYEPTPLHRLKLIANSSIFGEPNYYISSVISNVSYLKENDIFFKDLSSGTTEGIMEAAIDESLTFNFKATLDYAVELRNEGNMRLNTAVLMVRAMLHKDRVKFNQENPGYFSNVMKQVLKRPDDIANQFEYYLFKNKTKSGLPTLAKKAWGKYLSSLTAYQIAKYKTNGKLIDMVRISHAKSPLIDELMKTGTVVTTDDEKTWENLRSNSMSWKEILETTFVPHMALLKNLRNIFSEIKDVASVNKILKQLQDGVVNGKQFPFRYYSAYKELSIADLENKSVILDGVNKCMEIAISANDKIHGKVISLCDNSGSARGAYKTSHKDGKIMSGTRIADIGNLSGIMTAKNSDDGYIGVFGDNLQIIPITKSGSVFEQLINANTIGSKQGGGTENGLWIFFKNAIEKKEHWDTVFIYSDQQAGHGGLFGTNPNEYNEYCVQKKSTYLDLLKLVNKYRETVNPDLNVISVQIAGFNNNVLPENFYRGAILSGWTGKEVNFAAKMIKTWDEVKKENSPEIVEPIKNKRSPKKKVI